MDHLGHFDSEVLVSHTRSPWNPGCPVRLTSIDNLCKSGGSQMATGPAQPKSSKGRLLPAYTCVLCPFSDLYAQTTSNVLGAKWILKTRGPKLCFK